MRHFFRKVLGLGSITILCFFLSGAPNAQAIPVEIVTPDVPNLVQNTVTAASAPVTAVSTGATAVTGATQLTWDVVGKNLADSAAYALGQKALEQMTNNTIRWIQGGFQGSPKFAIDTDRLREDTLDIVTTDIANQLQGSALCDFDPTFKVKLAVNVDSRDRSLKQKVACPFPKMLLSDPKGVQKFYDNFKNGGWVGFEAALRDEGNPFGVGLIVNADLEKKKGAELAKQDQKLNWSSGFTSVVDTGNCNYPADAQALLNEKKYRLIDGAVVDGAPDLNNPQPYNEPNPNYIDDATRKAFQQSYCATKTPGKVISDQLSHALKLDGDRLNLADNMNKVFSAAIGQLTKQATEGIFNALAPKQKYRPAYAGVNTNNILSGLIESQKVESDRLQADSARQRKEDADMRVTDLQQQIFDLRKKMDDPPNNCFGTDPTTPPGPKCGFLQADLQDLNDQLTRAKQNAANAAQALQDAERTLARSIEKADRARAVKLTADAYTVLKLMRPSTPDEIAAANLVAKIDPTMTSAIALVLNATATTTSAINAGYNANRLASIYQANVNAADAALSAAQRDQFSAADILTKSNQTLINSATTYFDMRDKFVKDTVGAYHPQQGQCGTISINCTAAYNDPADWTNNYKIYGPGALRALIDLNKQIKLCSETLVSQIGPNLIDDFVTEIKTPATANPPADWDKYHNTGDHFHMIFTGTPDFTPPKICATAQKAANAALDAVTVARANANAVRGVSADRKGCISGVAPNCSGIDNVAQWIANAQTILELANAIQTARADVMNVASQSGNTI